MEATARKHAAGDEVYWLGERYFVIRSRRFKADPFSTFYDLLRVSDGERFRNISEANLDARGT